MNASIGTRPVTAAQASCTSRRRPNTSPASSQAATVVAKSNSTLQTRVS